ncbi:hypothetical protein B0E33_10085 [Roseibium algicola]|uniref:HTH lysR-type domain-containing protein n=1 Tax=Roseibium algicola TaxID=2857014 RepID=A0ABM6I0N4_9HYPH|nr:LysR family transcriptional regulator [Roseibium aggregatum]AQQ03892.1 hypothetical protein B0E33_10085 [Roseibium aggregatum]
MKTQIEVRHMRYAIVVAKLGSFRKAALALHVKQSTISRTMAQLEEYLGLKLFRRTTGGVYVTRPGQQVVRIFYHLINSVDDMSINARDLALGQSGQLTIGHYISLTSGNLRSILTEFSDQFPNVELRTVEETRLNLLSELASGFIDIAVVSGYPASGEESALAVWTERILVALPMSHPIANKEIVYWTDLKEETFLVSERDPDLEIQKILHSKLTFTEGRAKIVRHKASTENIRSLVGAGFGVSLIVECSSGAHYPGVIYQELQDGNGPTRINYVAYWRGDSYNPVLHNFIDLLEQRFPRSNLDRHPAAPSQIRDPSQ